MGRPAVMLHVADIGPAIKQLPDVVAGQLFKAMLSYAESDQEPVLDGVAAVAWAFIRPMVDRDGVRYDEKINQRRYAVYCREERKAGREPLTFGEWSTTAEHQPSTDGIENDRPISTDDSRYPTPTTTTTTATATASTTKSNIKGSGAVADPFAEFAKDDHSLREALAEFSAMRKLIKKPLTPKAKTRLLKKLQEFPRGDWVEILYQSTDHCWQDIFALKKEENSPKEVKNGKMDNNKWDNHPLPGVRRV